MTRTSKLRALATRLEHVAIATQVGDGVLVAPGRRCNCAERSISGCVAGQSK